MGNNTAITVSTTQALKDATWEAIHEHCEQFHHYDKRTVIITTQDLLCSLRNCVESERAYKQKNIACYAFMGVEVATYPTPEICKAAAIIARHDGLNPILFLEDEDDGDSGHA